MTVASDQLHTDILFVGLTRPTTVLGVPYAAFIVEIMLTTLLFLAIGNPFYLLFAAPLHGISYLMSAHDPSVFHLIFIWIKTVGRCRNMRFWGSASFSPARIRKW